MFLASLVGDTVRGMCYLHESVIRYHGNLRSTNCLIDSRWVLKIAGKLSLKLSIWIIAPTEQSEVGALNLGVKVLGQFLVQV